MTAEQLIDQLYALGIRFVELHGNIRSADTLLLDPIAMLCLHQTGDRYSSWQAGYAAGRIGMSDTEAGRLIECFDNWPNRDPVLYEKLVGDLVK